MRALAASWAFAAALGLTACATNPLVQAMNSDDNRLVASLLDRGVDYKQTVWAMNYVPLEYAAAYGKDQAIRDMVKRGADVNYGHEISIHWKGVRYTPLSRAVMHGETSRISTVRLLLDLGAKVDTISWAYAHGDGTGGAHVDSAVVAMLEQARERATHPVPPPDPATSAAPAAPAETPWWAKPDSKK